MQNDGLWSGLTNRPEPRPQKDRSGELDLARCLDTRRAAHPAPQAGRIIGPKLLADARPTKYSPGTDDSNRDDSTGCAPRTVSGGFRARKVNRHVGAIARSPRLRARSCSDVPCCQTSTRWLAISDVGLLGSYPSSVGTCRRSGHWPACRRTEKRADDPQAHSLRQPWNNAGASV
jgi:hypothetical protein